MLESLRSWMTSMTTEAILDATSSVLPHRSLGAGVAFFLLVAANGCAPMPPIASVAIPPVPPGEARIWFYRDYEPYAAERAHPSRSTAHMPELRSWVERFTETFLLGTTSRPLRPTALT